MRISGRFIGGAPYFAAHLRGASFHGHVWFLADTGASRTTLLDRDTRVLRVAQSEMQPAALPMMGVGGSVRAFVLADVEITLASDQGDVVLRRDVHVAQHDLAQLPPDEVARILRLPSVLGRDVLNEFRLTCDYRTGAVDLVR